MEDEDKLVKEEENMKQQMREDHLQHSWNKAMNEEIEKWIREQELDKRNERNEKHKIKEEHQNTFESVKFEGMSLRLSLSLRLCAL